MTLEPDADDDPFIRLGRTVIDRRARRLFRDGEILRLEPRVWEVLDYLLGHPGRAIGRPELVAAVWNGTHVVDEAVQRTISLLRAALGDTAGEGRLIETVRGGYRLRAVPETLRGPARGRPSGAPGPLSSTRGTVIVAILAGLVLGAGLGGLWGWSAARAGEHVAPMAPVMTGPPTDLPAPRAP